MPGQVDFKGTGEVLRSPLIAPASCFALGIGLAGARPHGLPGAVLLAGCGFCLLAGLIALRGDWGRVAFVFALAGFAAAGASAAKLFPHRFPPKHVAHLGPPGNSPSRPIRLEGWIASTPSRIPYGLQFDLEVTALDQGPYPQSMSGRVRVRVEREAAAGAEPLDLHYGDSIRAPVGLHRPRVYQNPGGFDFRYWMESINDLLWLGSVKDPLLIEKLSHRRIPWPSSAVERIRRRLLRAIDRMYPAWTLEGRNAAVLKAVLLGERTSIDSDTIENFRKVGLYHLLVIAGLHVGLLAMLASFLLGAFHLREFPKTALVLAFLLSYSFLVEQRAPTLRATVMICVYLMARLLYRSHSPLNAVALAALALLLYRPPWLFEAGFQLSFSAALLIAGFVAPVLDRTSAPYLRALAHLEDTERDVALEPRLAQFRLDARAVALWLKAHAGFLGRHPGIAFKLVTGPLWCALWCANILLFSAILQVGLLLPMAETFHRVSYAGVPLNALAIPVMTLLLGFAVPAVLLSAVAPPISPALAKVLSPLIKALFALTDLPHLPAWLSFRVPGPPQWVAWGFALSIVLTAWCLGRRPRLFFAGLFSTGVFAALISLHPIPPRLPRGILEVTVLDCGGGDAVFVVLPDQSTLLVDACGERRGRALEGSPGGRRWDPGEEIVSPYLWSRGLKRLDVVVLTDARDERVSGHAAVVRNFGVGEFWHGPGGSSVAYQELISQVRERRITLRELGAGDTIARGGVSIRVLWPRHARSDSFAPSGDNSLVLHISDRIGSVLLPGEISSQVERVLANSISPLKSRILKAARHASKSSCLPEFLAQVSPQVALVAAEASDPFERPYSDTLARLRREGARVFRTDLNGAITVQIKGAELTVCPYQAWAGEATAGLSATASAGGVTFSVR